MPTTPPEPSGAPETLGALREGQIVQSARAGDRSALAELMRCYQRRVYAVCYRMVRDVETAGDLTQDSLVKLIEGLDRYDGRSAFSTWAIRVTMNCCLSHLRKERLRRHRSLDEPAEADGPSWRDRLAGQREPSGPQRVEQAEMHAALLDGLAAIDPMMRAVLVLRDLQGLSYQQIGEVLDLPVGTVKSRLFRAREALREAADAAMGGQAREA